jgi:protein O-GlcNAcase/histone acetyltransferase
MLRYIGVVTALQFFANDYDISRVYFGPLLGRPQVLLDEISGIVQNPNCEYVANFAPIVTFGSFYFPPCI